MSSKQKRVLEFYQNYIKEYGQSPTYQQAALELEISPSVVYSHVVNLEKKGYLHRDDSGAISMESDSKQIPVLGTVACGEPIGLYEEVSDYIEMPKSMLKGGGNFYALIAKGDSMIKANINSGDTLLIKQQSDVYDGDIAVVVVGDSDDERATLKRVYHKPESIMLKAENDDFDNIYLKNCIIRGKLVGVMRNFA